MVEQFVMNDVADKFYLFCLCVLSMKTGLLNYLLVIQKTFAKQLVCIVSSQT